jgi:dTDP-4-dehydrorhamnose reductase
MLISAVDLLQQQGIEKMILDLAPDVIINCVGIIKHLAEAKDPILSIKINSLLPHQLANICKAAESRLIHISTDCVFSGKRGPYTESDQSDAADLYGRTKSLGEVNEAGCLTIRTSIVGRELYTMNGLVEWFLNNKGGKVKGYKKAIFTGFTTLAFSSIVDDIVRNHPYLSGIYQVSSEPINKYTLLCLLRDAFSVQIDIKPDFELEIDRSLDSTRFRGETGFRPPKWENMIKEMAEDPTPYDEWQVRKAK